MALADWSARLMPPERALHMTGDWPLTVSYELAELSQFETEGAPEPQPDQWQINLRCATVKGWRLGGTAEAGQHNAGLDRKVRCEQSCGMLAASDHSAILTIGDTFMSGVLRHMVTAHGAVLSGAGDGS
jgi:hypothetical protein